MSDTEIIPTEQGDLIETIPQDVEMVRNGSPLTKAVVESASTYDLLMLADQRAAIMDSLRKNALKRLNARHFIDQGGHPWICGSGAEVIIRHYGLRFFNTKQQRFNENVGTDNYFYVIQFTADVGLVESETLPVIGTCSSTDQLFSRASGGVTLNAEKVDLANIIKAAYTNLLVNGTTRFLGLRGLEWKELAELGINQSQAPKVSYTQGKGTASETFTDQDRALAKAIWTHLISVAGDEKGASKLLAELTAFTGKDGKPVAGRTAMKFMSSNQVRFLASKLKKEMVETGTWPNLETEVSAPKTETVEATA
jgi:hypothetical protein